MVNAAIRIVACERRRAQLSTRSARNKKGARSDWPDNEAIRVSPSRTNATGPICRGGTHNPRGPRGFTSPILAGMILVGTRTTKIQGKERKERFRLTEEGRGGSPAPIKPAPHRNAGDLSRDLRGAADARAARFRKRERGSRVLGKAEKGGFLRPCYLVLMWRFGALPRD